ncbi:MAG: ABC transporter permease [Chloroflexi bacterium]|nr:ABC transporter permease [Chloroflexota bacterium]
MNKTSTRYFPDKPVRQGVMLLVRGMFAEAFDNRWLIQQLFRRNFRGTYRQSLLGIFWMLIVPLMGVGTFIFLNSGGVLDVGETTVPYPVFAVAGTACWQVFSLGLTLSAGSLVGGGTMITKIKFPREALVFSSAAQGIIPSLLQITLVIVLFGLYRAAPPVTALLVPLAMIPLLLMTVGLGLLLALLNVIIRDVGFGISVLVTFLMFLTPVLYVKPALGVIADVTRYNPLYYLVAVPRDLLIGAGELEIRGFAWSALLAVAVFIGSWMIFKLTEMRLAERL